MLRLMLDAHPELAIPGESHFIPEVWRDRNRFQRDGRLDVGKLVHQLLSNPHVARWCVPEEVVVDRLARHRDPSFGDVVASLYEAYARTHAKPRWGDKTPMYVLHIPLLASLFPDARFVHLIRDGRDVALSYLDRPRYPRTIWQAAWRWRNAVATGRRSGRELGEGRYTEVRYEALVRNPRSVLDALCSFLDLRFDDRMLKYSERAHERLEAAPEMEPYQVRSMRPPQEGLRDWRRRMSRRDRWAFEMVAGDLLSELGYERAVEGSRLGAQAAAVRIAVVRSRLSLSRGKAAIGRALRKGTRQAEGADQG